MLTNKIVSKIVILLLLLFVGCSLDKDDDSSIVTPTPPDSYTPNSPTPADGAINQENVVTLSWKGEGAVKYELYFDDVTPPVQYVGEITSKELTVFAPGQNETYYWKVISVFADGSKKEGDVWSFSTKGISSGSEGYIIKKHSLSTAPPNRVRILFQVLDINENGIDNITINDIEIMEDGDLVSPTESNLKITKREENPYTIKTVLMLDNSSSITNDPNNSNNLDDIKAAAKVFVNNMLPQQEIAIYQFSNDVTKITDYLGYKDKATLLTMIDNITKGFATTDLYGAVIEGAAQLKNINTRDEIIESNMILFTDGDDTQGRHHLSDALDAVSNKSVYMIGLGSEEDKEVLEMLGTEGYYPIFQVTQLNQVLIELQSKIEKLANSYYWLEYSSPKRGNNTHLLQMKIKNNPVYSVLEGEFSSAGFFEAQDGLYFDWSFANPDGNKDLVLFAGGDSVDVNAYTYENSALLEEAFYSWEENQYITILKKDPPRNSMVAIAAKAGAPDTSFSIKVRDTKNNYEEEIRIQIQN